MMFILRRFVHKAVAIPESDTASDKELPLFGDSEKTKHVIGHVPLPPSESWTQHRKLPFVVKLIFLLCALAFTSFSGQSIMNYATVGYNAFLRSSKAHDHVVCSQKVNVDQAISISAPPITEPPVGAKLLERNGWEATCSSSADKDHNCSLAIHPNGSATYWQSANVSKGAGHWIVIDLKKQYKVHSLRMEPRNEIGGSVRKHRVEVATENGKWDLVALGTWREDDGSTKYATFEPRSAQFVRLAVVDTAQDQNFVAIGDINIYDVDTIPSPVDRGGRWNITLDFPLVPVTAFMDPRTQRLITMSADGRNNFHSPSDHPTFSATWDPKNGIIEEKTLDATGHDMFCPGTSFDESGRVIVTGGSTPRAFSIYNSTTNTWSTPENKTTHRPMTLQIPRGYQGQTFLPNGKTFIIGGTWSGNAGDHRDGELYDPTTGAWKILKNIKADFINMTVSQSCNPPREDTACYVYEWQQHHAWLFAWKNDSIFHAGPSKKMNWIFTTPTDGDVKDGGFRKDGDSGFADGDAVCGITSMYDAENGVILTAGGAPNYHYWFDKTQRNPTDNHRQEATSNAFEIKLGGVEPGNVVRPKKVAPMSHQRIFANAVILPNGETFVVGGQSKGEPFYDETWQPVPEIYSPETKKWRQVARHSIPRVYHSWAILLPDATVLVGGGGLNRPETDHYDAQIYQPAYLFTPDGKSTVEQPKIMTTDKRIYNVGDKIMITTNVEVDGASLIRYSATTHSLNNDMRRIKLTVATEGNASDKKYSVKIPIDPGVTLPGYWMLFVLQNGVPSHADTVQILAK
ncbi:hypothetical protein JMJ35_004334 [Cladonia borealis]|uniref:F5/8 type C domain-containing protein n=1 Tax=Cladonia borealis TaxID=184061 RepID=A0AA39R1W6_9LECA|nr:hypothetical protein JMJ35_004334 [Cladonia borealis]